jgi:small multidrug resistance family-3 protein
MSTATNPYCIPVSFYIINLKEILMEIIKSLFYFLLAGVFEIGGGYLVWLWLRGGKSIWFGLVGAIVLILYGVIPTLQPPNANFGRVYATYGGIFIALSILWGWQVDKVVPDKFDIIGGLIALIGVAVIMYYPRG